ncbi:phospholipase D/nuclease [Gloeophyllum trabeum ATCC 11539]|uniref:Phospholipase D/nuclease n=1 Tax=Gloeophyllum trabeum (strain ATCC 11539 / FP-39264 / Madison 617) TaxID=670483 RepID=S7RNJ6_GLOTA|nr:phospholipase D/nuclease [Gloeophyllum trabeum ATCC 11539]EPQ56055.1 phospholipase D/nuclease [Gloeophyllum trabeum ATCC 11539]
MSDDEDIRRAIALSLGEQERPVSVPEDDEEAQFQEDLQRALEASRASIGTAAKPNPAAQAASASSFLSERAQLEKARLERQKRLRGDTGSAEGEGSPSSSSAPPAKSATGMAYTAPSGSEPLFWDGELRQTANKHVDPKKDTQPTFRLSEIIGKKSELSFALVSSYALMLPWLYEFFNPSTPVILVAQPDHSGHESIRNVLPNWVMTTPFLRNGRGCMHIKFMLLFYKTGRLRVVVTTANFVDFDWRDIENTVWLQDIPLRSSPIPHDPKATDFPAAFERVLKALNVRAALDNMLKTDHPNLPVKSIQDIRCRWDFSKVKVKLVASLAGKHEGWPSLILTGHTGLMKALRDLGLHAPKDKDVVLECQGSSIGTYSTQWMNEFHCSARGDSAEEWLDQPKSRRAKLPWPPVKILFPSLQTVRQSVLGENGGGTMFCRRNQWDAAKFPRELFHDSRSKRGGVLMHTKMIIATFRDKSQSTLASSSRGKQRPLDVDSGSETEDSDIVEVDPSDAKRDYAGWAYVGSHNFTPSAWGTLSGSAFTPILNITNYEMGIVFPIKTSKDVDRVAAWERPPCKYESGKDVPWMQDESSILAD